ncbi:hypothetical protein GCK32_008410 [Trichostrongylus colubriformis]|uniref:Uncharacterized protein n=1 Tax=Trichostrongylus colubriformis TaxID=6319 RepID=A0AAN8FIQ4_TRICO
MQKAESRCEEWKMKHELLKQELENSASSDSSQNIEVDRLTAENERLVLKIHELAADHQLTVADLTAMQENQSQFVDILTKKIEQLKEEKSEWLMERESMVAEIAALKEDAVTQNGVASEKMALEACIENLTKEVADLTMKGNDQKELVNRVTNQLADMVKEKEEIIGQRERYHI